MLKRLLCLFSACAVLFFCSVPAFATGTELGPYTGGTGVPVGLDVHLDVVDFGEYVDNRVAQIGTGAFNFFGHLLDEDICPNAPQVGGGHKFEPVRTMKNGQVGLYYQCEYCGKAYGDALEEAYQEYVETLPGKSYNSDGAFLWVPGVSDFASSSVPVYISWGYSYSPRIYDLSYGSNDMVTVDLSSSFPSDSIVYSFYSVSALAYVGDCIIAKSSYKDGNEVGAWCSIRWPDVFVPVDGIYTLYSGDFQASLEGMAYAAGKRVVLGATKVSARAPSVSLPWPSFWVEGYTGGSGGNTYEISTRVAGDNNTGLYGYVQDGQLYQSTVGTIYNETSNIYQNPVTGDTSNISSWQYDYSDRSYTLTTNEGDTVSVTYGDEHVTINEGGTTYNVYYLMEEPDNVQEDTSHTHSYSSSVTTPPTCTGTGVKTYTCTECGKSYTETIPATGHSYSESVVTREPTCTDTGIRTGTCTICGDKATEVISALGHDYSSAVTMDPTCINTGVRTFTCSRCGKSYTETIPATGHIWGTVRTVPTQYDEQGNLTQQGYTLYRCATCGEQYRIDADSGGSSLPAPSSGGTSTGTDLSTEVDSGVGRGFLATIAHGLTDDLPEVLKSASEWFVEFPKFYGGFTSFLTAGIAGCLPDVPKMTMGFGIGMVTFIGIICKIIGR